MFLLVVSIERGRLIEAQRLAAVRTAEDAHLGVYEALVRLERADSHEANVAVGAGCNAGLQCLCMTFACMILCTIDFSACVSGRCGVIVTDVDTALFGNDCSSTTQYELGALLVSLDGSRFTMLSSASVGRLTDCARFFSLFFSDEDAFVGVADELRDDAELLCRAPVCCACRTRTCVCSSSRERNTIGQEATGQLSTCG